MVKFSQDVRDFLSSHLAYVATCDKKGMPNVVPKGDIAILEDGQIVFADLYSHDTRKNLTQNPNIAITIVNPASYTGYQLKGRAEIIERGEEFDALSEKVLSGGQLNHPNAKYAVRIKVSKIIDIGYGDGADKQL